MKNIKTNFKKLALFSKNTTAINKNIFPKIIMQIFFIEFTKSSKVVWLTWTKINRSPELKTYLDINTERNRVIDKVSCAEIPFSFNVKRSFLSFQQINAKIN